MPCSVNSIVSFAPGQDSKIEKQQNLQQLSAIVLEDVINTMSSGQELILFNGGPKLEQAGKIGVWLLYHCSAS
ncbi:hypothetical protein WL98_01905 [Burkholderia multivorans]|nr:hypothetical protein WL98_01905 [Burkholderia multivorans]